MTSLPDLDHAVISCDEVAELLGVRLRTCYSWVSSGRIPKPDARKATTILWHRETIVAWLDGIAEFTPGTPRKPRT